MSHLHFATSQPSNSNYVGVCPPPSELVCNKDPIRCEECSRPFKNRGALRLHLVKSHRRVLDQSDNRLLRGRNFSLKKTLEDTRYFCPVDDCKFSHQQTSHFFKKLSALKEHYRKVHQEKTLVCSKCNKTAFSLEKSLRFHEKSCWPGEGKKNEVTSTIPTPKEETTAPAPTIILLQFPVVTTKSMQPHPTGSRSLTRKMNKILPKLVHTATQTDHPTNLNRTRSISIQCDLSSDQGTEQWTNGDQTRSQPSLDGSTPLWATFYEATACQTVANSAVRFDTTAVQSDAVACSDFFCQTNAPPTADASVSADFHVATTTNGQQCQLPFSPSMEDFLAFTCPQQHRRSSITSVDDGNSAWTNNQTQTDIAMVEFDDLFPEVVWNDMETQT